MKNFFEDTSLNLLIGMAVFVVMGYLSLNTDLPIQPAIDAIGSKMLDFSKLYLATIPEPMPENNFAYIGKMIPYASLWMCFCLLPFERLGALVRSGLRKLK